MNCHLLLIKMFLENECDEVFMHDRKKKLFSSYFLIGLELSNKHELFFYRKNVKKFLCATERKNIFFVFTNAISII